MITVQDLDILNMADTTEQVLHWIQESEALNASPAMPTIAE